MKIKNKIYLPITIFLALAICVILNYKMPIPAMIDKDEENFVKSIESLSPNMMASYAYIDSLHSMIEETKPNLIIRCKVSSRGESDVISPIYTAKDLDYYDALVKSVESVERSSVPNFRLENAKYASACIATPYEIEILEVYHGNSINEIGDKIVINAPYGIVNGVENRQDHHPIFKVDDEYILFLRVDEMYGKLDYYLAFTPASCVKINLKDNTFEYGDFATKAIYSKYEKNLTALTRDLKNLISFNADKYNTVIEKFGDMEIVRKLLEEKEVLEQASENQEN